MSDTSPNNRLFGLEPILKARIAATVQVNGRALEAVSLRGVSTDLAKGDESILRTPCALVAFDGYRVRKSEKGRALVDLKWTVVLVIENVRDVHREGARDDADVLADQLLQGLLGWLPPEDEHGYRYRHLELDNPMFPVTYMKRNSYFPFSFTTERTIRGAAN
jgi:hypothetical protein